MRVMLLNPEHNVIAEIVNPALIAEILTVSILTYAGVNYIYDNRLDNGEYSFFGEAGALVALTAADVKETHDA